MANVEKLRETLNVIRANKNRWNQRNWARGTVNPDATHWSECGVSFCFAGWRCALDGLRPDRDESDDYASGEFISPVTGTLVSARIAARESLELTIHESEVLFLNMTNDFSVLEALVKDIIAGKHNHASYDEMHSCHRALWRSDMLYSALPYEPEGSARWEF